MNRLHPLAPPHKGIRNALGQASIAIDSIDVGSGESIDHFKALIRDVATILHDHAHQEDHYIFAPAERVQPGLTHECSRSHHRLHQTLDQISSEALALNEESTRETIEALERLFHGFHRDYLDHMMEEEDNIETVLIANFSDEEMMADQGAIMAEMPFETLLLWFRFIVPARSIEDNRQVLAGFTAAAPPEAVAAVWDVLRGSVSSERFIALTSDL